MHLFMNNFLRSLFWQDADSGYLAKCNLEEELSGNIHDLDFLKSLYAEVRAPFWYFPWHTICVSSLSTSLSGYTSLLHLQELREMKEQLKNTSVVVEMDNSRQLDMDEVVKEVKRQYEEVSARSWQEAKAWYKKKVMTPLPLLAPRYLCMSVVTYLGFFFFSVWAGIITGWAAQLSVGEQ